MKFLKSLANVTINLRWVFFGLFIAMAIGSIFLIPGVGVNYDLTKYLPESSPTKIALTKMEDEFGAIGNASIMISGTSQSQVDELIVEIQQVNKVSSVLSYKDNSSYYNSESNSYMLKVFFDASSYDNETSDALARIKTICSNFETAYAGESVDSTASKDAIAEDIPIILLVVVLIVLGILTFTSKSWLEPIVYLCVIGCAILINFGTNILLGEISFVTQSISAIMLIALEMDYCIVLCSRFREEEAKGKEPVEAMKSALAGAFTAIIASSLTVIAGLVALMFMNYSIGFDIGAVLAKGVFISILAVLFFMPSIILLFSKALHKTAHKNFLPQMDKIAVFAKKTRYIVPALFLCVITASLVLSTNVNYTYIAKNNLEGSTLYNDEVKIEQTFGKQNSLIVLVPNSNVTAELDLYNNICNIEVNGTKYINSSSAIVATDLYKLVNASQLSYMFSIDINLANNLFYGMGKSPTDSVYIIDILNYVENNSQTLSEMLTPQQLQIISGYIEQKNEAVSMFCGKNGDIDRLIFNINLDVDSEDAVQFINELNVVLENSEFDANQYYVINETSNLLDTENTFSTDKLKTDLITICGILLIILVAFRSLSLPILLVLTIQGAIWINMALSVVTGGSIFFICYLLAMAIQMGATIDYGILLSDRYTNFRKKENKLESMKKALNSSITTILSSGLILICAAFTVHFISTTPIISEIGLMVGRGALVSVIAVIFVLPSLLILFDKIIEKTSKNKKFLKEQ